MSHINFNQTTRIRQFLSSEFWRSLKEVLSERTLFRSGSLSEERRGLSVAPFEPVRNLGGYYVTRGICQCANVVLRRAEVGDSTSGSDFPLKSFTRTASVFCLLDNQKSKFLSK